MYTVVHIKYIAPNISYEFIISIFFYLKGNIRHINAIEFNKNHIETK